MLQPTALFRLPDRLFVVFLLGLFAAPVFGQGKDVSKLRQEAMELEKPLSKNFAADEKEFRRTRGPVSPLILRGAKGREAQKVEKWLELGFKGMTNPKLGEPEKEGRPRIPREAAVQARAIALLKAISDPGSRLSGAAKKAWQKKVFEFVRDNAKVLLDGNYYVRKEAVRILGSLGEKPRGGVAIPYDGSKDILIDFAKKSPFPELRILAYQGLARMIRAGQLNKAQELDVISLIAGDLAKAEDADAAYRLSMLLTTANHTFSLSNGTPEGLISLAGVLIDKSQSFIARGAAAKGIGFTGEGSASVKWDVLAWAIADFVAEASVQFNAQAGAGAPVAKPVDAAVIFDAYLAFQPDTKAAVDAKRGLLYRASGDAVVRAAYQKVLPVTKGVLLAVQAGGGKIPAADIAALQAWVKENKPKDLKYHNLAPPLKLAAPAGQGLGGGQN